MSKLDIVILGATGFTGNRVVEELAIGVTKYRGISWAVAGRSKSKLQKLLNDTSEKAGVDLSSIKVIIAEVGDYESLKTMCGQARVLLNCCGPYRLYGEPVVRAAIDAKTHYLDISGEEDFIATIQMKYDEAARKAGIYVINACGFDDIPNDLGVVFLENNFEGTLNSVESYLSLSVPEKYHKEVQERGILNFGTWESAVYVISNFIEVLKLRQKVCPKTLPECKPKLRQRLPFHKIHDKWAVPHISPDESIVCRTQRRLYEMNNKRPVQFKAYFALPSFYYAFFMGTMAIIVGILSQFKYGRDLLLSKPGWFTHGLFSRQEPSQVVIENTDFLFEMIGRGWATGEDVERSEPNKIVVAKISGKNPGYGVTSLALMQSALTILKEKHKMPPMGGVLTSGAAFWDTSMLVKLQENNVKFEIIRPIN